MSEKNNSAISMDFPPTLQSRVKKCNSMSEKAPRSMSAKETLQFPIRGWKLLLGGSAQSLWVSGDPASGFRSGYDFAHPGGEPRRIPKLEAFPEASASPKMAVPFQFACGFHRDSPTASNRVVLQQE